MILTTCPSMEEAEKIARILLTERLAACVNTFQHVKSFYWWQDEIQEEQEIFLFIKTTKPLEQLVQKRIKELHSYEVPALYALDSTTIIDKAYMNWIEQETRSGDTYKK